MKETELKPCPFCGGEARRYKGKLNLHGVVCKKCGAKIYGRVTKGSATRAWNRRADNEQREAMWVDNHCTACGMTPIGDETWTEQGQTPPKFEYFMSFCSCCGAKMKGGAE